MDWVPVVFATFKAIVLCVGVFYAVKWHYDKGQREHKRDRGELLRAGAKLAVIFGVSLLCLGIATFFFVKMLGVDLG